MATTASAIGGFVAAPIFGEVAPVTDFGPPPKYGDVALRKFGDDGGTANSPADENLARRPDPTPATLRVDEPVAPTPPPAAPSAEGLDAAHRQWHSIGDPHIRMGGENFDNQHRGSFVLAESRDKAYQVQAHQDGTGDGKYTVNTQVAVKDGQNVVKYDVKTKKLLVNGKEWDGQSRLPGGTRIDKSADGYRVTSSQGDVTDIHDKGFYLDLEGEIGPNRKVGEIRGAHGVFDNTDGAESHLMRNGGRAAGYDEMIDSWQVGADEDLLSDRPAAANASAGGPADLTSALKTLIEALSKLIDRLGLMYARS